MNYFTLLEDSRQKLINKSKSSVKGRERLKKRTKSRVANTVKQYNQIDMQKLFKDNILTINIQVRGETDDYIVRITFGGFLDILRDNIERTGKFDYRAVVRSLITGFNKDDVYISCSCLHPDTKIRLLDGTTPTVSEMKERYDNGEQLYVYSTDDNGDFKPGIVENVWITKETTDFIKVTLDNDEEIITTPDHLYMLRDGTYAQADSLIVGQSLMPMYNKFNNGYEAVKFNSTGKYHSTYKEVAKYFKQSEIDFCKSQVSSEDDMPYDVAIHHIDFNKTNNNPENLLPMTARQHWNYHNELTFKNKPLEVQERIREKSRLSMIEKNKHPTDKMIESRKMWQQRGVQHNYNESWKPIQKEIMSKAITSFWDSMSEEEYEEYTKKMSESWTDDRRLKESISQKNVWKNYSEKEYLDRCNINKLNNIKGKSKQSEIRKKYWNTNSDDVLLHKEKCRENIKKATESIRGKKFTTEHSQKIRDAKLNKTSEENAIIAEKCRRTKWIKNINSLLSNGIEVNEINFENNKKSGEASFKKFFDSFEQFLEYLNVDSEYNHKIKSIEHITLESTPVYDIKVKDYHNFTIDSGVVLHNCPDFFYRFSYWATRNQINSGEKQDIPSDETNPDDSLGSSCKHVLLVLNNTSWLNKVASVIFNYTNYMEKHYQKLYADIIYPAIYGKDYEEPVQMPIDGQDELDTSSDMLDKSNEYGRTRTQFKQGNTQGVRFASNPNSEQQEIDIEDEE